MTAEDQPPRESEVLRLLAGGAERTVAEVGDGCVVRMVEGGGLPAVSVDHVELGSKEELLPLLAAEPLRAEGSWLAQALDRRQTVRLPDLKPETLREAGLPPTARLGDVMIVPIPSGDGVIVALRDRWSEPYNGANRRQVEDVAADLAAAIAEQAPDGRGCDPGSFDPAEGDLLDATSAALWVVDPDGCTLYVNEAASELVGSPARQIVGEPLSDFLGRVSQHRRGGFHGSETVERPLVRADGSVVWLLSSSRPLRWSGQTGECTLYTLVTFDELHYRDVNLRMRLARTEALLELAEGAGAGEELDHLLHKAVALIAEQLDVELAGVASFEAGTLRGKAIAHYGWPASETPRGVVAVGERSATAAALRFGEPVLVWDYETQTIYVRDPLLERLGARSAALVPFAGGSAVLGAHSPRPGAIDGDGLALIETVARLIEPRWQVASIESESGSPAL